MHTIAVLGAGSWGTALAVHLGRLGHDVRLWGRDAALVARLAEVRENADYLPGVRLVDGVRPTASSAITCDIGKSVPCSRPLAALTNGTAAGAIATA